MWKALAVEDCQETSQLIERSLAGVCEVVAARSAREAFELLEGPLPDLILLDVELPDGDGYQICSRLQGNDRTAAIPVVFLTARSSPQDKVAAFFLGADDYVSKPFEPLELRARVSARLNKERLRAQRENRLERGPLRIDLDRFRATARDAEGERVLDLTPHEFRILHVLAAHPDRVFTRLQLLERVWDGAAVVERTIDTHMSNLRRKLGPHGRCIRSVRGVGYRLSILEPEPHRADGDDPPAADAPSARTCRETFACAPRKLKSAIRCLRARGANRRRSRS